MIIVKLIGGLGNQMFQYSCGRFLANKHNTELKLDISGFDEQTNGTPRKYELGLFNIKAGFATENYIEFCKKTRKNKLPRVLRKILKQPKIIQGEYTQCFYHYNEDVAKLPDNVYLDGYWQSEKYFKPIENVIKQEFSLNHDISEENKKFLALIKSCNAVSLHIRRGDYVKDNNINNVHGTCSLDYYYNAINYIARKTQNPHFFLFSDDIEWVKNNIQINYPVTIIDCNNDSCGYFDMMLMKDCKHNIIANSSFSWWGAWLNSNDNKIVIAPQKWFNNFDADTKDLIPNLWVRL